VYVAQSSNTSGSSIETEVRRVAGGSKVNGRVGAPSSGTAYVYVIAWRIS
jgi:hypothetical protein